MKKSKMFIISIFFNIVFIVGGCGVVYSKGGISYIKEKVFKGGKTNYSHEQRESLFEDLKVKKDDIIMLGDSLTQRCEWSELLNDNNIKNRGIDGDKTSDVLNRLDCITKGNPNKIFLMIGINDLLNNINEEDILENYNVILDNIKSNSINTEVYVESVLPVRDLRINKKIDALNSKIEDICKSKNVTYINIHDKFKDKNGFMKEGLSKDGVHLTSDGYKILKESIGEYLD